VYIIYFIRSRIKMTGHVDIDSWLSTVKGGKALSERDLRILCEKIKEILIEESNV